MSDKFFFKGKTPNRPRKGHDSYSDNRESKPGTENFPISVNVQSDERKAEVEALLKEHSLFATITVNDSEAENIAELDSLISTPKTVVVEEVPKRNEPCSCGSGKKYKKCCG